MSQSLKLKKSERERIIFEYLKTGKQDPLYEVSQTKYGKYLVRPKQIEVEEEEAANEEPEEQEEESIAESEPEPIKPKQSPVYDRQEAKRERRRRSRHAKQNAKRILDALTNLINSNNNDDSSDDDDTHQAPPLIEPPNFNPQRLSFRRRRLAF